ncbi:hypothetical protein [Emticicia agri]|uniref:Uncharacterized protein n=1 Tax=Emticicia agri TaxID=2492393 RepID=A0A4Q5LZQ7_9BACT|nr:hypothetical protein [Emticicia agri]RYU95368.1 hypothetical protein EWM59_11910 [Emticicia agri]
MKVICAKPTFVLSYFVHSYCMFQNGKQIIPSFFFMVGGGYLLRLLYLQVIDDRYLTVGSTKVIKKEVQIPLIGQIYGHYGANKDVYLPLYKAKNIDISMFCQLYNISGYYDSTMAVAGTYSGTSNSS